MGVLEELSSSAISEGFFDVVGENDIRRSENPL
jgi:hypothetical protein